MRNQVCDSCYPQFCENCYEPSTILNPIRSRHRKPFVPDHQNHCLTCREYHWVNIEGFCKNDDPSNGMMISTRLLCPKCTNHAKLVCVSCQRDVEAVNFDGICYSCAYVQEGEFVDLRLRECKNCHKHRTLNLAGVCEQCMINQRLTEEGIRPLFYCTNCSSLLGSPQDHCTKCGKRKCVDCQETFSPHIPEQFQCDDCLPKCLGCDDRFITNDRSQRLCDECQFNADKGICPACERSVILTPIGICPKCEEEKRKLEPIHWCRLCHDNLVERAGDICTYCIGTPILCPTCSTNLISSEVIQCDTCKPKT